MRLKDKSIIVTGSTTGIGEAIARRFVAEGARVVLHGLERDLGEKVLRALGDRATLLCNDISHPASGPALVGAALNAFGKLDAIVNNAGTVARSTLESTDAATFDRIIGINLRGPLLLIRAALEELKKTRGSVLNVGSINAHCGAGNLLAYSISKGGLMTMTRNLANALMYDQVRVNQINPGWVLSENEHKLQVASGHPPDWHLHIPKHYAPSGRIILPEEIANIAVYWIGDESRPISGSVVDLEQYSIVGRNTVKEKDEGRGKA